jgi:predicted site-specific integrase-resolvase
MPKNNRHVSPAPKATSSDIANHWSVSLRTLQNWRDTGMIPFIRINARVVRYDLDAVSRALHAKMKGAPKNERRST